MKTTTLTFTLLLFVCLAGRALAQADQGVNSEKAPVATSLAGPPHWQNARAERQPAAQGIPKDTTSGKKDETPDLIEQTKLRSKSSPKKEAEKQV